MSSTLNDLDSFLKRIEPGIEAITGEEQDIASFMRLMRVFNEVAYCFVSIVNLLNMIAYRGSFKACVRFNLCIVNRGTGLETFAMKTMVLLFVFIFFGRAVTLHNPLF